MLKLQAVLLDDALDCYVVKFRQQPVALSSLIGIISSTEVPLCTNHPRLRLDDWCLGMIKGAQLGVRLEGLRSSCAKQPVWPTRTFAHFGVASCCVEAVGLDFLGEISNVISLLARPLDKATGAVACNPTPTPHLSKVGASGKLSRDA